MVRISKETKSLLCYVGIAIIVVAFLMSATSCASRKVNKSEVKEEAKTEQTVKEEVNTDSSTNTTILDTSETTEIEIVPIDNSKPIEVNGKKYVNARLKLSKKKNAITTNSNEKVSQIAKKEGKKTEQSNKQSNVKETTKPDAPIVSTWKNVWFILELAFYLFLLIAIYYVYKKYVEPRLNNKNNFIP